nr:MAG TPA: hypothetical protein [Bacteriophage sp.]
MWHCRFFRFCHADSLLFRRFSFLRRDSRRATRCSRWFRPLRHSRFAR